MGLLILIGIAALTIMVLSVHFSAELRWESMNWLGGRESWWIYASFRCREFRLVGWTLKLWADPRRPRKARR